LNQDYFVISNGHWYYWSSRNSWDSARS